MHPSELSYPCYLSILGDLAKVTPHEESFPILNPETANFQTPKNTDRIEVLENSPSGLWRTLGKRVGCKPSGVRIPYSPPVTPLIHCSEKCAVLGASMHNNRHVLLESFDATCGLRIPIYFYLGAKSPKH